jgi:hypothetical protein
MGSADYSITDHKYSGRLCKKIVPDNYKSLQEVGQNESLQTNECQSVKLNACFRGKFGIGFRITLQPVSPMADPRGTSVGAFINVDSVKLIASTLTLDSSVITSSLRSPVKSTSVCNNRAFETQVPFQTLTIS